LLYNRIRNPHILQTVSYKQRRHLDTARIAALLDPFLKQSLNSRQLEQISTYIDLLLRWNARINLTAIRHPEEIVTRHFGESFFLARHVFPDASSVARTLLSANPGSTQPQPPPDQIRYCHPERSSSAGVSPASPQNCHPERSHAIREADDAAQSKDPYPPTTPPRVLDIGSGAGFPALPLKIWAPNIHLTLVESNHKKATFLREVTRALTLTDIDVRTDRAELLAASPDFPRTQVVTLRAVERFETILPQAIKLLAPQATLALLIGKSQLPYLNSQATIDWHPPIPVPQSNERVLATGIHNQSGILPSPM
jgi:16S rRNA (guanine(527)-N(7))-methyltransferase RsmG